MGWLAWLAGHVLIPSSSGRPANITGPATSTAPTVLIPSSSGRPANDDAGLTRSGGRVLIPSSSGRPANVMEIEMDSGL